MLNLDLNAAGKEAAVHIWKSLCPSWQFISLAISSPGIHRPEYFADHLMSIGRIPGTHLLYGVCEQAFTCENIRVLGKETKNEPGHEVVHLMALFTAAPIRIVFQKLDVKSVQATGSPYIERAIPNLLNR